MPKIRLSALATDIKGKSGGSVFSKNKGGTYYRDNPSGGGKKTQKSTNQKVKFGSVATQWRKLNNEQREAWEQAAANYPALNAWSEPYIPSGYQLFMTLNGVLSSNSLPINSVPQVPRALPIYNVDISTPDNFCFVPQSGISFLMNPQYFGFEPSYYQVLAQKLGVTYNGAQTCVVQNLETYCILSRGRSPICSAYQNNYSGISEPQCSTNEDCDGGSNGHSDVECQNGKCVYVGDGLVDISHDVLLFEGEVLDPNVGKYCFSIKVIPSQDMIQNLTHTNSPQTIICGAEQDGKNTNVRLTKTSEKTVSVYYFIGFVPDDNQYQVASWVYQSDYPLEVFQKPFTLILNFDYADGELNHSIYVNGIQGTNVLSYSVPILFLPGTFVISNQNYPGFSTTVLEFFDGISIFCSGNLFNSPTSSFSLLDARYFADNLDNSSMFMVTRGYVLGNEEYIFSLDNNEKGLINQLNTGKSLKVGYYFPIFKESNPGEYYVFDGGYIKNVPTRYQKNTFIYAPVVIVNSETVGENGFMLQTFSTIPSPSGINLDNQRSNIVQLISLNQSLETDITESLIKNFGSFPLNSNIQISFKIFDATTGVLSKPKNPKRLARFKAGSDLMNSVP